MTSLCIIFQMEFFLRSLRSMTVKGRPYLFVVKNIVCTRLFVFPASSSSPSMHHPQHPSQSLSAPSVSTISILQIACLFSFPQFYIFITLAPIALAQMSLFVFAFLLVFCNFSLLPFHRLFLQHHSTQFFPRRRLNHSKFSNPICLCVCSVLISQFYIFCTRSFSALAQIFADVFKIARNSALGSDSRVYV